MDLFSFYIPDWIFVAINLVILILVLKRVLWKRINGILDERSEKAAKMAEDSTKANELRAEMEQLRTLLDAEMESRTVELMKDARARAGQEYERIIADAERKAGQILTTAKFKAEQERGVMIESVKKQVISVAIDMSGLLLESAVDSENNRVLLEEFLADKDVLK